MSDNHAMAYAYAAGRDPTAVVGRRITAYVIDGLLVLIAFTMVLSLVDHNTFRQVPSDACSILRSRHAGDADGIMCVQAGSRAWVWDRGDFLTAVYVAALIGILNLVVLQTVTGASVGKHTVGLRVVDQSGQPAGFGRTIVRWLFLVVDGAIVLIGLIAVLSTSFHRRIGDFAAGTFVVAKASAGRPVALAPKAVPYGGPVFAAPTLGALPEAVSPSAPAPLAPGWGVAQAPVAPDGSVWTAPPSARSRRARADSSASEVTAAPPSEGTPAPVPSPAPTAPPPAPQTPPAPASPAPASPAPIVPAAPARPAVLEPKVAPPPKARPLPQPEAWWNTAIPDEPADGEERP